MNSTRLNSTRSAPAPVPVRLHLHQKSRILDVEFSDGRAFSLSCEYLRVHSPSAEVRGHGQPGLPPLAKEGVNISRIEEVGHYAVKLHFDDGHNTGLYSWSYLYELGIRQKENWQRYLAALQEANYTRKELKI